MTAVKDATDKQFKVNGLGDGGREVGKICSFRRYCQSNHSHTIHKRLADKN